MFFVENIGKYEEWDNKGTLIISGQFEEFPNLENEMIHSFRKTFKVGNWKYFDNKGKLTKEEFYNEKGELIKTMDK